jgi:hypothetical protein
MTHSNLSVEVQGIHILVVLRGTCFRAKYRKQEAPWLATAELGPDDPEAPMTLSEFRSLAWAAANETGSRSRMDQGLRRTAQGSETGRGRHVEKAAMGLGGD